MRIVVISDTHRDFRTLQKIVKKHQDDADLFIHLGDGEHDVDELLSIYPNLPIEMVKGNCDQGIFLPYTNTIFAGDVKIFLCHGHTLSVKSGVGRLVEEARRNDCRIALYGHTHCGETHYEDGIYVMNPGSPSCPRNSRASYGIIDIEKGGILPFLVEI